MQRTMWKALLDRLPRGYTLEEEDWQRRHRLLLWVLALHVPALALFGVVLDAPLLTLAVAVGVPVACLGLGRLLLKHRRTASVVVTAGLSYCSAALVVLTAGSIEAHFHFFIIIGFIALYQDWAPFLFNILFTVLSHGVGSLFQGTLIFDHLAGQSNPWLWSLIHGVAVLFACVGMMMFWRITEESQQQKNALAQRLADAEIGRRQFTSDLLVNLARRNQGMVYRQLDIINQLEETEQDPDALAELFRLDHMATRVRRNAESLLVLSGEQPARVWSEPVPLRDVVRAAIAETEDLERVVFLVDEKPAVAGNTVTDLTHLLAELTENAVRFSPPDSSVTIRARPDRRDQGGHILTIEDWGVGMSPEDLEATNALLAEPPEVDMSVSKRLGFHVVARLAARHGIGVSLYATPGSGITAAVALPSGLFEPVRTAEPVGAGAGRRAGLPGVAREQGDRVMRGGQQAGPAGATRVAAGMPNGATAHGAANGSSHGGSNGSNGSSNGGLPQRPTSSNGGRGNDTVQLEPVPSFGRSDDQDGMWTGWWSPDHVAEPGSVPTPRAPLPGPAPATGRPTPPPAMSPGGPVPSGARPSPSPVPEPRPTPEARPTPEPRPSPESRPTPEPRPSPEARPTPEPRPAAELATPPAEDAPATVAPKDGVPFELRRRVPQAHLSPELRRPSASSGVAEPAVPVPVAGAADALSRYQASRKEAQSVVEGDGTSNPDRSNGW